MLLLALGLQSSAIDATQTDFCSNPKQDLKIKTGFKLEQLDELLLSEHSLFDAAAAHNPPLLLADITAVLPAYAEQALLR